MAVLRIKAVHVGRPREGDQGSAALILWQKKRERWRRVGLSFFFLVKEAAVCGMRRGRGWGEWERCCGASSRTLPREVSRDPQAWWPVGQENKNVWVGWAPWGGHTTLEAASRCGESQRPPPWPASPLPPGQHAHLSAFCPPHYLVPGSSVGCSTPLDL